MVDWGINFTIVNSTTIRVPWSELSCHIYKYENEPRLAADALCEFLDWHEEFDYCFNDIEENISIKGPSSQECINCVNCFVMVKCEYIASDQ